MSWVVFVGRELVLVGREAEKRWASVGAPLFAGVLSIGSSNPI